MKLERGVVLLVSAFIIAILMLIFVIQDGVPSFYRYTINYAAHLIFIVAIALIGFNRAKTFGLKSAFGKSIALIALGLVSWGIGNTIWLYYNVVAGMELPYPSLADIGFVGMIPLAAIGMLLLLKNIRMKLDTRTLLTAMIFPIAILIPTYILFIDSKLAEEVPMIIKILNVIYPLGDAIILSFAVIVLFMVRGSRIFKPVGIICFGFIVEALADFSFSWATTAGTFYVGGLTDFLFTSAFFVIAVGLFYTKEIVNAK